MRVKRIEAIQEYIIKNKSVSMEQLCEEFGVSMNTIRRDIDTLCTRGSVIKVYGGVVANTNAPVTHAETLRPFTERSSSNNNEKLMISQKAASYVQEGDIIFLDSGTTTLNMIPYLANIPNLTVITYSIPALVELLQYKDIKVISLPGLLLRGTESLVGSCGVNYLSTFNMTKAFMACTGISLSRQVTNATFEEYEIKQAALDRSEQHFLLADHDKFGNAGIMTYADITRMDYIITDDIPAPEYAEYFDEKGVGLDIALSHPCTA